MALSKRLKTIRKFALVTTVCVTAVLGEDVVCSTSVQQNAVNKCTAACGDIGECIFGCEIGGINNVDVCNESCGTLGPSCLNSCLQVGQQITSDCTGTTDITSSVTLKLGTVAYNRATGIWQQTVVVTNTTENTLNADGYILDSLNSGWTLSNGDGVTSQLVPTGSPYKNFGPLAPNSAATVTLQFSRTGTTALTYSPRVLSGSAR